MCRAVNCRQCGKTTWAGCGQHVDQVRRGVPAGDWCSGQHTATASAGGSSSGWLGRLLGRD